jgi:putrescine transport system permease protein
LPIVIFSKVRLGVTPEINALATVMIVVVAVAVIGASWAIRRRLSGRDQNQ